MNEEHPRETSLSVVMPVYNGEKYLAESIESVLGQTYRAFEFIIVDDGSSDATKRIIEDYQSRDSRIRAIHLGRNGGISNALNTGIKSAKGDYIVRADCDDINDADRFSRQLMYFQEHSSDIDVLGAYFCLFFNDQPNECEPVPVRVSDLYSGKPPVHHPTCMIRRETFLRYGFYRSEYDNAEDYELWSRWVSKGVRFENMPDILYRKRIHGGCTSVSRIRHQNYLMLKVNIKALLVYRRRFSVSGYKRILEQFFYWIYLGMGLDRVYTRSGLKDKLKG